MALTVGQIYTPSGAAEVRDDILTDIRLAAIERDYANPPVHPGTDWHILASAVANIALIQYTNIRLSENNGDVLRAVGPALDNIRNAEGLPEVSASPAFGKLTVAVAGGGTITIPDGLQFLYPNGLRGKVSGLHMGVADGDDVDVIAIDTGASTNLNSGEVVRWVSPPLNLEAEAEVSLAVPLREGTDNENDARKRERILNRRRNLPQGGNPGFLIETALNSLSSVQAAFVYPALGGPSSVKVVLTRAPRPDDNDWGRTLPDSAVLLVRQALWAAMPDGTEIVASSVDEETVNVALEVEIPDATTAGGNGQGWMDATVWPQLETADLGKVTISSNTSTVVWTLSANTATAPIAGQTHIAWWSTTDQKFYPALVTAVSGSTGAWVVTIDRPWVDSEGSEANNGDYVSPLAVNTDSYGEAWRSVMSQLGPSENTSDAYRLPRSLRFPFINEHWQSDLTFKAIDAVAEPHKEITNIDWGYRSRTTPTLPASVSDAPKILIPNCFGIYAM